MNKLGKGLLEVMVSSYVNSATNETWDVTMIGDSLHMSCGNVSCSLQIDEDNMFGDVMADVGDFMKESVRLYKETHPAGSSDVQGFLAHHPSVEKRLPALIGHVCDSFGIEAEEVETSTYLCPAPFSERALIITAVVNKDDFDGDSLDKIECNIIDYWWVYEEVVNDGLVDLRVRVRDE